MSCSRDKIDFGMADDIRFRPEMEAPLLKATLTLKDLTAEDTNLVVDPDDGLRIMYRQDSLFGFDALEFVEIPEQPEIPVPMSPAFPIAETDIELGTLGGVELDQGIFNTGKFNIRLEAPSVYTTNVEVEVTIKNAIRGGAALSKRLILPAGNTSISDFIDLPGAVFDFSGGQQKVNYIGLKVEIINPTSVLPNQALNVNVQFADLKIESATGFFGQRDINIPSGSIDFDISGLSEFAQGFYLTEPNFNLISSSTIGAALRLKVDFDGANSAGEIVSLQADEQIIAAADNVNSPKQTVISYNSTNSAIVDFLAALPNRILYDGKATINPGSVNANNFIDRRSRINVGMEVDIPLKLRAENMMLDQKFEDVDFFKENPDDVEALTLIFFTDNGFPFDMNVDVDMLHAETGDSINGFSLPLLTAAPVDGDGRVTKHSTPDRIELTFDKDMLESLKQTNALRFRARLNTANNGQQVVKLFTDYNLTIKIAARVKLNLSTSN